VQGFSVGGEMGGATAFLIESAPPERRGFYASWQFAGQAAAALIGSLIATALTRTVSPEDLAGWAWRIPFIVGLAIGPLGLYLRSKMDEPAEFKAAERLVTSPALAIFRRYKNQVARSFGATILGTAGVYLVFFYTPTYAIGELGETPNDAFIATTCASLSWLGFNPLAGRLSDIVGRRRHMLIAAVVMGVLVYPLYSVLVAHPALGMLIAVQGTLAVLVAMYIAPLAALIGEMFPANLRATGLSAGYSFAVPLFGGFAPFLVARFQTGDHLAPAYYMMFCSVLTIISLSLSPTSHKRHFGPRISQYESSRTGSGGNPGFHDLNGG
jgi:MHS family proline/betaine transporter-like MFS transporter